MTAPRSSGKGTVTPVAFRIALRDLARYRARSSSALAAVSIGVMIAVIITVFAQVRYSDIWDPAGPNVAPNQALIWIGSQNPSASALKAMAKSADVAPLVAIRRRA